jgi:hypothetical protein
MRTKDIPKTTVVLALTLFFVISSCGGSSAEDKSENSASNYKLEVFDSLQFDILTSRLTVADVDPETGDMLVLQPTPPKYWLFDKDLNMKAMLERPKDDPEGPGEYGLSATFFGEGIATLGWFKVTIYDREFNFEKAMIPNYPAVGLIMSGYKNIYDFRTPEGEHQLITYYGQPQTNLAPLSVDYYKKMNIVDLVKPSESENLRDSVFYPFGKLTPDSRYLSGKYFPFLMPVYDVKGDKFYNTFNSDTTLYVRSLPDADILNSYTIPFDKFILMEGAKMGSIGQRPSGPQDTPGQIQSVFHHDKLDVIIYTSGLKVSEKAAFDRTSSNYRQQVERANPKKYIIIRNGERVNKDLTIDKRVYYMEYMDDNGIIYAMQDSRALDKEPEKYTIYKLRIVEDN